MFKLSKQEIKEILSSEAVYNNTALLVELGEFIIVHSNFDKVIDKKAISAHLRHFIDCNDINVQKDFRRISGLSEVTIYKVLNQQYTKESTRMKIYSIIAEYGQLKLK